MKNKKIKMLGIFLMFTSILVFSNVSLVSAYNADDRQVIIKLYKTYVDNDGRIGNGNHDWRWATIYNYEGSSTWYVRQRETAGAHHSDWTSPTAYQDFVIFNKVMSSGDRIDMIFEDYSSGTKILHRVRITINSLSACSSYYLVKFTTGSFTPSCGFSASTIDDGPGSGNYQTIVIGVFNP